MAASGAHPALPAPRLDGVDCVRGAVMVLMLLDHTRDFVHYDAFRHDPLDLATTSPLLFATRWITHLCAPTFVFLAGLGAGLQRQRGKSEGELRRFLWTRGLWLAVLELTLVRAVMWFNLHPSLLAFLQVIWAVGISLVVLSFLVRVSPKVVGLLGVAIVLGHNLLDAVRVTPWRGPGSPVPSAGGKLWMVLHQGGLFPIAEFPSPMVLAQYPLLPWLGVLLAGYGASLVYAWPAARRRRALLALGGGMLVAFVVLRWSNVYGDPRPWSPQAEGWRTALSFLNVQKYPPSACFVLATLAPAVATLGLLDGRTLRGGLGGALVVFGRVPLFFYVLQWIAAHLAGIVVSAALGKPIDTYFMNVVQIFMADQPPDVGGGLRYVYASWLAGTVVLYWPCRWFASVKARERDWWLGYL